MSAIGAWFARAIAAVGGPQTGAIVLVAGLVAGGAGGVLIATNARSGGSAAAATVSVYPCPNQGPALQTIANGDKLLVTGRLADDSWLRIHLPTPGRTEGWIQAGPLTVNGSVDSLPVATCAAEAGAPSPAIFPAESLTAIVTGSPSPSPAPTPTIGPSVPPSPSAPPANTGPTLASLAVSARTISYDQGSYCPSAAKSVSVTVKAADSSGVASVALFWRRPGASTFSQSAMSRTSGSAASGTWQATLDTSANGLTAAGSLAYYVVATDTAGAKSRIPSSGTSTIAVAVCANKGPTITSVSSSSGSSLYWDPLSLSTCQTASGITATVSDPDGVKSVTLFFRRPGASTYSSEPMDNHTIPGKWTAYLDTLGNSITIPRPPTGSLSWYIKAVDGKNASAQSKTVSMTIRRCDSPASVQLNQVGTFYVYGTASCPSISPKVKLKWTFYVGDPDTITSATLTYKIVHQVVGMPAKTSTGTVKVTVKSQPFFIYSAALAGASFQGGDLVTWTLTAVDKYGGKTTAGSKATITMSPC